jgi:hypothetical protein
MSIRERRITAKYKLKDTSYQIVTYNVKLKLIQKKKLLKKLQIVSMNLR